MHKTLIKWLEEIEEETQVVTSGDINEEASSNLATFGFNESLLAQWGKESVIEFLNGCLSIYKRKKPDTPMVFYVWFDEQADQIRMCAVRQSHGKLPFGCEYCEASTRVVVDGIFSSNSGLYTSGSLNVWQKII